MLREPLSWVFGKVLHAHDASRRVAELMRSAQVEGAAYYQRSERTLGDLGTGASPARHLVARRVVLPSSPPFFDPRPFLEAAGVPRAAAIYDDPGLGELPSTSESGQRGELRRCCLFNAGGARELAGRMDAVGMLGLVRASEVRRPGGLFGVDKKLDPATGEMQLRLIFDRRPRNAVEEPLRDLCGTLAQGSVLCELILEPRERVRIWLSDLPNYYYTFLVSPERMKTNAWGGPIPRTEAMRHEVAWAALSERGEADGQWFYRAANTMAMGDTNAVEFGQGAHVGLLKAAGCMQPGEALRASGPPPRGPVWEGVVVDDHAIIARCGSPVGATEDAAEEPAADTGLARARRIWAASHESYDAAHLTPVPEKSLVEAPAGRVWGAWLDGEAGNVGAPRTRRAELAMVSLDVASLGWGSRGMRRQLTGLWVNPILYRRELLCVLEGLFAELGVTEDVRSEGAVAQLSPAQRDELALLAVLSPLMETNLRAPVAACVHTSDASPTGAGGTVAPLLGEAAREMWRHRERRGFAAVLEQYEALYQKATGREEVAGDDFAPNREWVSEVVASLPHRVTQRFRFSARHHINVGEMRARRALLRKLARRRSCGGTRQLIAYDSRVTIGVAAKGRSPSRALNHEERRAMPYLVGPDIQEGPLWVDSKRNPADHPSREKQLPPPAEAPSWVAQFLQGDLAALDRRLHALA